MSSTNRGAVRERDDFYETPPWVTELVLPVLGGVADRVVLDPFAGRGAILDVCDESGARGTIGLEKDAERAQLCAREDHPDHQNRLVRLGNTFSIRAPDGLIANELDTGISREPFDLIITNPPFSHAAEAVRWCIARHVPTAVLLRLAFLESAERLAFHRKHPADVHVLSRRPSFLTPEQKKRMHEEALERWRVELAAWHWRHVGEEPKKPAPPGSDSSAYAWFVWGLGGGRWSVLG